MRTLVRFVLSTILLMMLTACGISPQVMAEERLFLNPSLEFLGEYQLPKLTFQETLVQGLSALTYNRQKNCFYVLSDDPSQFARARFYTVNLSLNQTNKQVSIDNVEVEAVTFLTNEAGKPYAKGTIDPEGIALSPRGTVFISSEG
ncbi:MAG: esterase-like activity of phytase family protein, partial [Microcystaceae cyanobacterium]